MFTLKYAHAIPCGFLYALALSNDPAFNNKQLFLEPEWALSQKSMRPKAEWAIDSDAMRARGIIVSVKYN